MKNDKRVIEIIQNKLESEYKNDVLLLVLYGNKKVIKDDSLGLSFYFVPKNERAKELSIQFILEGVSYDLFPMSWERLVSNAALDSPQGYLILDTEVVYYSDESAVNKFEELKNSLKILLSGDYDNLLINKAYEYLNECYVYLYNMKKYKDSMSSVKLESGKLLNKIAISIGFANREYYKNGNGTVISDSLKLNRLPKDYVALVNEIIFSNCSEGIYQKSFNIIENTRDFLMEMKKSSKQVESFETLFTGYYEELKKSINKCKVALLQKDYYMLYELFAYIQEEVSQFIAATEVGIWYDDRNAYVEYNYFEELFNVDFLKLISQKDDGQIQNEIERFEKAFVALMKKKNITLLDFDSLEELVSHFREK